MRVFKIKVFALDGLEVEPILARAERREEAEGVAKTAALKDGAFVIGFFDGEMAIEKAVTWSSAIMTPERARALYGRNKWRNQ